MNEYKNSLRVAMEKQIQERQENERIAPKRNYIAPKGTCQKAVENKKATHKLKKGVVAAVLAASLTVGGVIGYYAPKENGQNEINEPTLETLIQTNTDISSLGLSSASIETITKYNEFFGDRENQAVSNKELMDITNELYDLNLRIVKEKIAVVTDTRVPNIRVQYAYEKADGRAMVMVEVTKKDGSSKEETQIYEDIGAKIIPVADQTTLPKEFCNFVWNLDRFADMQAKIENRSISSENALKELQTYFENIQKYAQMELVQGKDGKLALVKFEEGKINTQTQEER